MPEDEKDQYTEKQNAAPSTSKKATKNAAFPGRKPRAARATVNKHGGRQSGAGRK